MAEPDGIARLVTAELRCAYLRAKSAELEIQHISDLLKWEAISPLDALMAVEHLGWSGLLHAELYDLVKKSPAPKKEYPAKLERTGGKNADAK